MSNLTATDLRLAASEKHSELKQHVSAAVAWDLGKILIDAKATVNHANWMDWLCTAEIPEETAQRCLEFVQHTREEAKFIDRIRQSRSKMQEATDKYAKLKRLVAEGQGKSPFPPGFPDLSSKKLRITLVAMRELGSTVLEAYAALRVPEMTSFPSASAWRYWLRTAGIPEETAWNCMHVARSIYKPYKPLRWRPAWIPLRHEQILRMKKTQEAVEQHAEFKRFDTLKTKGLTGKVPAWKLRQFLDTSRDNARDFGDWLSMISRHVEISEKTKKEFWEKNPNMHNYTGVAAWELGSILLEAKAALLNHSTWFNWLGTTGIPECSGLVFT